MSSLYFENSGPFFHGRLPFKSENPFKSTLQCECSTLLHDVFTTFTKISNRIFGAGKSSAIAVVERTLNEHGIEYVNTREPGGTPLAESLREMVKSVEHKEKLTVETELLLMYASRSQLLANKILPALAAGKWVIGDRHDMSSRAYQGGGRGFDQAIMNTISDITLKGFRPDITLYLDIDPHIGLSRAKARGDLDRIELEKMEFFIRVHNKYRELAKQDKTIITLDAAQTMVKVHQDVEKSVVEFIANTALV